MNQNPTKLKTTFTGVSVVINSPARLPSHPPPYQYPAHRPSKLRKTSSTSSIDPLDPTCPQSTPQQPKQPDVYVPKSLPVPILSRGPCTASPSYGLERIVGRFYDDDSGPWYYKVEKRRRHYTTPEKEEANVALTAAAGDYLTEPERKIHQIIKTEDSSTTSGTSTSQSQSGGEEPYQRGHEYFLVPPQDILDHVSAAELEVFENNYVRRQGLEEETERQAEMERRQRVMERKRQLAAAAKAQGLAIDMKKTGLETQTASVRSQSRSGMFPRAIVTLAFVVRLITRTLGMLTMFPQLLQRTHPRTAGQRGRREQRLHTGLLQHHGPKGDSSRISEILQLQHRHLHLGLEAVRKGLRWLMRRQRRLRSPWRRRQPRLLPGNLKRVLLVVSCLIALLSSTLELESLKLSGQASQGRTHG